MGGVARDRHSADVQYLARQEGTLKIQLQNSPVTIGIATAHDSQ
jgi:hypothetical protein